MCSIESIICSGFYNVYNYNHCDIDHIDIVYN